LGHETEDYQAGLSTKDSFSFNMGLWAMACVGTVVAWFILPVGGGRVAPRGTMTLKIVSLSVDVV
jgi:hypothetical protein